MTAKSFLAVIVIFDFFAVILGYEGISRLRSVHFPPFNDYHGFMTILVPLPPPPNWLVLAWDASWGRCLMWGGCFLFPLYAFYLSNRRMRHFTVAPLMLIWTIAAGSGLWICIHALFNAIGWS